MPGRKAARRGRVGGGNIVVRFRVGVEGKPIADEGEPVGKVESAETRARVLGRILDPVGDVDRAEKTPQEGVEVDGLMPFSSPDDGAFKAKVQDSVWV